METIETSSIKPTQIINGRYILRHEIGRGGMGIIYQATDRLTGEAVALKRVGRVEFGDDEAHRQALAHEFQILASLRHPHIISVLDYGFDADKRPFFTMTYLSESQSILTATKSSSFEHKIELVEQLLQGLIYLHRRGILHRDIKPGNVLVVDSSVRLLDFGLSQSIDDKGHTGGSAIYMAPELIDGGEATVQSDLYAVGVLLYVLLTGHHPFGNFDTRFFQRLFSAQPELDQIDERVQPLLNRLLSKEPRTRPDTAVDALTLLAESLDKPLPEESDAIRDSHLQAAKFVGRQLEFGQLTKALEKARLGSGSGWLLGGESGVGKTRLIRELQTEALVSGFLVLQGQSKSEMDGAPYQLWRDLLRHAVIAAQEVDDLTASVLLPLVPDIHVLLKKQVSPAPELSDRAYQLRLFTTINTLLQNIDRPVLIILEDLHWSRESLLPIDQLMQQIDQKRLMLIGSYRNDERPDLPETLPAFNVIELKRLSSEMITELSYAMLGEVGTRPEVIDLLQRETEGNAFFAIEVVRALSGEVGRLSAVGEIELPERLLPNGIRDIIHQRLEKLSDSAKSLLILAAIAGREIDLQLMRSLAPEVDINTWWLSECADAAVLEVQQGEWRFNHDKLREGLLDELTDTQIASCHQQVASALELLHGDTPDEAARLAYHWHHAGNASKEITFSILAGEHAAAQFAYEDAISHFSQAIVHLPSTDLNQRYSVLLAREAVWAISGIDRQKQLSDLNLLEQLADQLEDVSKKTKVATRKAEFYVNTSKFEEAIHSAQQALEHGHYANEKMLISEAHWIWGNAALRLQTYDSAIEHLTYAINYYRSSGNLSALGQAIKSLGNTYLDMGKLDNAIEQYEKVLTIAHQIGDHRMEAQLYNNLGIVGLYQTNYVAALNYLKNGLALIQTIGDLHVTSVILENYGSCFYQIGDYATAFSYMRNAILTSRQVNTHWGEHQELIWLSMIVEKSRAYTEAITIIEDSIAFAHKLGMDHYVAERMAILGFIYTHQQEYEKARALFDQASAMFDDSAQIEIVSRIKFFQAKMAHAEERWESAIAHYKAVVTLLHDAEIAPDVAYLRVASKSNLAFIALITGDLDKALSHAEPAIAHLLETSLPDGENDMRTAAQCYIILKAAEDPRAKRVLERAYTALQERTSLIESEAARKFSLEAVPEHQFIVELYESTH